MSRDGVRGPFQAGSGKGAVRGNASHVVGVNHLPLLYTLLSILLLLRFLSYLMAVPSKLFLSQPVFSPSSSPLQPATGEGGSERLVWNVPVGTLN